MSNSARSSRSKSDAISTWGNRINNSKTQKEQNNQYKKACRVCLVNTAQINIFDVNMGSDYVHTLLMRVSEVQIELGDGLPTEICNRCLKNLKAAYQFKELCETTDRTLRQKLNIYVNDNLQSAVKEESQNDSQHYIHDPLNMDSESYSHEGDTSASNDSQLIIQTNHSNIDYIKDEIILNSDQLPAISTLNQQINGPQIVPVIIEQPIIKKSKARKNAVCAVCYQRFQEYEEYQAHVRTHNGEVEKPYKCKECGKGFLCVSQLNRHLYTHTDVKLYECTTCRKGFNNASHLKSHMYVHTGEKPYACKICNKKFNQMPHLRRHMISHEKEKEIEIMDLSTFQM